MSAHSRPDAPATAATRLPRRRRALGVTLLAALSLAASSCASFAGPAPAFSPAPTLTPNVATVIPPGGSQAGSTLPPGGPGGGQTRAQPPSAGADPCAPPALPVVAVCLDEPWGLAPLPTGDTALVGERVSGRILSVRAGQDPDVVATITGLDTSHGGGLLGLALSPYYAEDGLIYAYVTTPVDARVVRLAVGQQPKPVVTGLPVGAMGGSLIFGADGLLYIAAGSAAGAASAGAAATHTATATAGRTTARTPATAPRPTATAPATGTTAPTAPSMTTPATSAATSPRSAVADSAAVYRVDTFGRPAPENSSGTRLFAAGLTDPTGMCLLPDGRVGAMEHRATGDVLIALADGRDYGSLVSGDAVWIYSAGDGGAIDCAVTAGELTATSRAKPRLTTIEFGASGGFTGSPTTALDGSYGMLRTAVSGPGPLTWLTTANGHAEKSAARGASASDDRVVVLPPTGAGGGGGGLD